MTTSFAELGLDEHILSGVEALGFTTPTPVQAQAIPAILEGRDVVASAQTGTGKTAAFALPVLQRIAPSSRAAREELIAQEPSATDDADDAGGTGETDETDETDEPAADVVQFAASEDPHISGPVPADGDKPKPRRRRRRRHHKRADDAQATRSDGQGEGRPAKSKASDAQGSSEESGARRRAKASDAKGSSDEGGQNRRAKASGAQGSSDEGGEKRQPKPRKRRRSRGRKRRGGRAANVNDSRERDPNARPFGPFALVVTPTRELAQQIDRVVSVVCEHTGQRAVIVVGGARFERQIRELEAGCDMLVATPGRLIDLMEHNHVDLSHVEALVLDEADRMLDMGFWPSVRRILAALPAERQNLLFSATIPPSIQSTIDTMLHDPVKVEIARVGETADTVEEHLCPVTQGQKLQLLQALIRMTEEQAGEEAARTLVFCRTKHRVDDVSKSLKAGGFKVDVMHADRPQKARERALAKFREGTCHVLVATDVMSRGIDVSGIDAVVNFDVPLDPEDYVHRIGRTGRAGATGHAYTFVAPDEISPLREIEYFTGKLIPTWDLPGFDFDDGRIVPGETRSTVKPKRTMFSGTKSRGRGISGGRYGRHY